MFDIGALDIGATNCRGATARYDPEQDVLKVTARESVSLVDFGSAEEMLGAVEARLRRSLSDLDHVCVSGAGQWDGEELKLDPPYRFPIVFGDLARKRKFKDWSVIHDYSSVALATLVPAVMNNGVTRIRSGKVAKHGRRIVFGIGSGLGVKDLYSLPHGGFILGKNETGHIGVPEPPVEFRRHRSLIQFLRGEGALEPKEPLTMEKILQGEGLSRLHWFLTGDKLTPEEVGGLMEIGAADETKKLFAWYLGLFVGTLELSYMPSGGIYASGGVLTKHACVVRLPQFNQGRKASPSYMKLRGKFPFSILPPECPLSGAALYGARKLLASQGHGYFLTEDIFISESD